MDGLGWRWFGDIILSGFLLISGFSLFWGWRYRFHSQSVRGRFLKILISAAFITIITYLVTPDVFVYFGVLHHIAVGSIILVFVRKLPLAVLVVSAILAGSLPSFIALPVLDGPWGWCLGLSETVRPSNDAVPLFPWFSFMLVGGVLARLVNEELTQKFGSMGAFAGWFKPLAWVGKHSLLIYLLHQPLIWGVLLVWERFVPMVAASHVTG